VGHQPGFRKRSSVLNCLSIVAGSCAHKIMDETTRATINNAEHASLIKNSSGLVDGTGRFDGKRNPRQYLLPFACTLHNRDVAIDGEIRKALDDAAGLGPTHFQGRDFGLLADAQYEAGIMRGQKAATAHFHPASFQVACLVRDAGADRVGI
jgi:hypothetical protein